MSVTHVSTSEACWLPYVTLKDSAFFANIVLVFSEKLLQLAEIISLYITDRLFYVIFCSL